MPMPKRPFAQTDEGFIYTRLSVSSRQRPENPYKGYKDDQPPWTTRAIGDKSQNVVRK